MRETVSERQPPLIAWRSFIDARFERGQPAPPTLSPVGRCTPRTSAVTHGSPCERYPWGLMLPVIWALFAVLAVGGFLMIAAYWLDVQDRPDFTVGQRIAWSAAAFLFPLTIPAYAFLSGAGWPPFLRAASVVPALAVVLFAGFVTGRFS
jgi:hypothetical protein